MDEDEKPRHPLHADPYLHGWLEYRRLFHRNGVKHSKIDIFGLMTIL